MRRLRSSLFLLLGGLTFSPSNCDAGAGAFKTGAHTGVVGVVLVVALAVFFVTETGGDGGGT